MSEFQRGDIVVVDCMGRRRACVFNKSLKGGFADVLARNPNLDYRAHIEDISWASENHDNVFDLIREQGLIQW